ncbi:MAG: hypothetical protein QNL39_02295 [Akkermansiaceae bacterium]
MGHAQARRSLSDGDEINGDKFQKPNSKEDKLQTLNSKDQVRKTGSAWKYFRVSRAFRGLK